MTKFIAFFVLIVILKLNSQAAEDNKSITYIYTQGGNRFKFKEGHPIRIKTIRRGNSLSIQIKNISEQDIAISTAPLSSDIKFVNAQGKLVDQEFSTFTGKDVKLSTYFILKPGSSLEFDGLALKDQISQVEAKYSLAFLYNSQFYECAISATLEVKSK